MSIFRNAVKDCLDYDHIPTEKTGKTNRSKASNDVSIEKFSGLRMRYSVVICITKLCTLFLLSYRENFKERPEVILYCNYGPAQS